MKPGQAGKSTAKDVSKPNIRPFWQGAHARAVFATLVVLFLAEASGIHDNLNRAITDRHHRWRATRRIASFPPEILIVAVDDRLPAPTRTQFARLVHQLSKARVVCLDYIFDALPDDSPGDAALAEAVKQQGRVVVGLFRRQDARPVNSETERETKALLSRLTSANTNGFDPTLSFNPATLQAPYPALRDAAHSLGYVDVNADSDNVYRAPILVRPVTDGVVLPHLTVAIAALARETPLKLALENTPGRLLLWKHTLPPLGPNGSLLLQPIARRSGIVRGGRDHGEPIGLPVPSVSIVDALKMSPQNFDGKIILVGQTTTGSVDIRPNPLDNGLRGVELNAEIIANLLYETPLQPTPFWLNWLFISAAVAIPFLLYERLTLTAWRATAWSLAALVGLFGILEALFWIAFRVPSWSPVLVGWASGTLLSGLQRAVLEDARRRDLQTSFGMYVAPELVERLLDNPAAVTENAERRYMAILFSDIRGFTPYSEQNPTELVVRQMEEYLTEMTAAVFAHRGFLDKFIGDAIMALFNPLDEDKTENWSARAVACGLEMQRRLEHLNDRWEAEGLPRFDIGIGIHAGDALFGNIGAKIGEARRIQPTALGDSVNFAARLQSETKERERPFLVSEAVRDEAQPALPDVHFTYCGEFTARGRTEAVRVYAVSRFEF